MGKHVHSRTVRADRLGRNVIAFAAEAYPAAVAEIEAIVVEQTGAKDCAWNVELDGNEVIADKASVGAADTPETFYPNAPNAWNAITSNENAAIELVRKSVSGTTTSELHVTVLTDDNRGD